MYNAVIFDLDGTLIDSEGVWFKLFREICAEYGKEYTAEIHAQQLGCSGIVCATQICEALSLPISVDEFHDKQISAKARYFSGVLPEMPGAIRLVQDLHKAGIPLAVATASPIEYRERMLQGLGISECFVVGVSNEEVDHPKPAPDIYLRAAELLGADPSSCLAVEDGQTGVVSANAAGMQVLGVVDRRFNTFLVGVKKLISSLDGFTVEDVRNVYNKGDV